MGYKIVGVDDTTGLFPTRVMTALKSLFSLRTSLGSTPQFHGCRYTAYGHSFGQVQTPPNVWAGALYPAQIRTLIHADPTLFANRTVTSATMEQIASAAASNWVDGSGGLVTLMGNQNSLGHGHGNQAKITSFKNAVRSFLTTMQGSTGKPPTVLVVHDTLATPSGYSWAYPMPSPTVADVNAWNSYLDEVIAEFPPGWIITADPASHGWDPSTMTSDGLHPNELGMACITRACLDALSNAPYRPGLNLGIATPLIPNVPGSGGGAGTADFAGANGSQPPGFTTVAGSFTIQNNAGQLVTSTGAYSAARADYTGMTARGDIDFTLTVKAAESNVEQYPIIGIGGDGLGFSWASGGYSLWLDYLSSQAQIHQGNSANSIANGGLTLNGETTYKVRIQLSGTTLRAKVWVANLTEPNSWLISTQVTSVNGKISLGGANGSDGVSRTFVYDDLVIN